MWELDHKESWALKNWCFWTVVLEKTLESPLDSKEIKPVNPKGNQSWIFIGRTYAKAEAPIHWPPDAKIWLIGKDPDTGKDWRQEEKGTAEDEMVGWHHRLDGPKFEQALRAGDRQGSLACSSPWGHKESDMTEWLKNSILIIVSNPWNMIFMKVGIFVYFIHWISLPGTKPVFIVSSQCQFIQFLIYWMNECLIFKEFLFLVF